MAEMEMSGKSLSPLITHSINASRSELCSLNFRIVYGSARGAVATPQRVRNWESDADFLGDSAKALKYEYNLEDSSSVT